MKKGNIFNTEQLHCFLGYCLNISIFVIVNHVYSFVVSFISFIKACIPCVWGKTRLEQIHHGFHDGFAQTWFSPRHVGSQLDYMLSVKGNVMYIFKKL